VALSAPAGSVCAGAGGQNLPLADITWALSHPAGCPDRIESLTVEEALRRLGPIAEAFALDQQFSRAWTRRRARLDTHPSRRPGRTRPELNHRGHQGLSHQRKGCLPRQEGGTACGAWKLSSLFLRPCWP
jgi:hypothetical protein